jgi:predicted transcriptional regulator
MALSVLLRKKASQRDIAKIWGISQPAINKKIKNFGIETHLEEP